MFNYFSKWFVSKPYVPAPTPPRPYCAPTPQMYSRVRHIKTRLIMRVYHIGVLNRINGTVKLYNAKGDWIKGYSSELEIQVGVTTLNYTPLRFEHGTNILKRRFDKISWVKLPIPQLPHFN